MKITQKKDTVLGGFVLSHFDCVDELTKIINTEVPLMDHRSVPLSKVIDFQNKFREIVDRNHMNDMWTIEVVQVEDGSEGPPFVVFRYQGP